jgi:hypothetical protein
MGSGNRKVSQHSCSLLSVSFPLESQHEVDWSQCMVRQKGEQASNKGVKRDGAPGSVQDHQVPKTHSDVETGDLQGTAPVAPSSDGPDPGLSYEGKAIALGASRFLHNRYLKAAYSFAKNMKELSLLAAFWLAVVSSPFSKPAVEVTYRIDSIFPPLGVEKAVGAIAAKGPLDINGVHSLSNFIKSQEILHLRICNNSSESIQDVDLQVDAATVSDVAIRSNSSRVMADRQKLAVFQVSDDLLVTFPNFKSIPAKAEIDMILWGNFNTFFFRAPVKVLSTGKDVHVIHEASARGLGLFVAAHLRWLAILLGVGLLLLGLRRFR